MYKRHMIPAILSYDVFEYPLKMSGMAYSVVISTSLDCSNLQSLLTETEEIAPEASDFWSQSKKRGILRDNAITYTFFPALLQSAMCFARDSLHESSVSLNCVVSN